MGRFGCGKNVNSLKMAKSYNSEKRMIEIGPQIPKLDTSHPGTYAAHVQPVYQVLTLHACSPGHPTMVGSEQARALTTLTQLELRLDAVSR